MKNKFKIRYQDLWGLREEKYKFLETHNVKNTDWQELESKEPNCFFVPKDTKSEKEYDNFVSVSEIFDKFNAGVATGKDKILLGGGKIELLKRLSVVDKPNFESTMQSYKVSQGLIDKWYKELANIDLEERIITYSYRLFDNRFLPYDKKIIQRARVEIMDHMLFDNLALVTTKQLSTDEFHHVFITKKIADRCLISLQTREVSYFFPLYLHQKTENNNKQKDLFDNQKKKSNKISNIKKGLLENLKNNFKQSITSEDIFYYIYAVLFSNTYRQKYNEFLKIDFPKIPFTNKYQLFKKLSKIGEELVNLHLLKSKKLEKSSSKFPETGDNIVEFRKYYPVLATKGYWVERVKDGIDKVQLGYSGGIIAINKKQIFTGVPEEVWNYYIGGYQVLDKWLKDKTDKILTRADINHYLKIISSIEETIKLQQKIDKIYPKAEKDLIK